MIFVDTDVLAIHHIFTWDKRREANEKAVAYLKARGAAITIHNLLELCGLYGAANMGDKVEAVIERYLSGVEFEVKFPPVIEDWGRYVETMAEYVRRGLSYSDALIAFCVEAAGGELFITWNKRHFDGRLRARVLTPVEYLGEHR
ncbi:MAG: hypothetical protein DRN96_05560 [Thermoproteota archaeon]|nr:MAG: hypothetical protein DRN96_05560 [Candidatus Korarchaeota archaeon]